MGNPTRILMMAMAVASGNAFIVSPKAQLVARRTLPHARAMPIVAAFSKIEGEAKDTEVCPRLRHVASSLRPARARGPLPPPSPPAPPPCPIPVARPLPVTHLMTLLFTPSPRTLNSPHCFRLSVPASAPAGTATCGLVGQLVGRI